MPVSESSGSQCASAGDNSERVRAYEIAAYLSASSFPFDIEAGPPPSPAPSSDLTLNALVQHGVHKLDCERAFLSLIDNRQQFICAEMTKSQSLASPNPDQPLLLGTARIPLEWGVCPYTMSVFSGRADAALPESPYIIADKAYFYIKDFRQVLTFADRPYVAGYPNMVSYIEVPLRSLSGHIVGSYCVVDNQSRDFLAPANLSALREVAVAINGYLDSKRLEGGRTRSEKMMEGLCNFIDLDNRKAFSERGPAESNASHASPFDLGIFNQAARSGNDTYGGGSVADVEPSSLKGQSLFKEQDSEPTPTIHEQQDRPDPPKSEMSGRIDELLSKAASTIGHAMSLDGLIFFDAVATGAEYREGVSSTLFTGHQNLAPIARDDSQVSALAEFGVDNGAREILDYFPSQSTLQLLTTTYPHGHVFAMDKYGILDYGDEASIGAKEGQHTNPVSRSDWKDFFDCLPKARYAVFLPLWDYKRESCFATCLAWVSDPAKSLDFGDVNSLTAFGNSLMVEILRIEALASAQVKSDFISSISHELRSPLHGIMTTTELMQSHLEDSHLLSMIDMIDSCSSALLDTFDHLLEFSKINSRAVDLKYTGMGSSKSSMNYDHFRTEVVDLSSLAEDVTEIVLLGHSASERVEAGIKKEKQSTIAEETNTQRPLLITTYIQRTHDWIMTLQTGAWKRILMNILSNSLKYTKTGYIDITLKMQEQTENNGSFINLSVTDTGIGISPEFLKYHLFTPFKQEDTLYPGSGLGLSMVKSIVESLNGHVLVESGLQKGTRVTVNIPVTERSDTTPVESVPTPTIAPQSVLSGRKLGLIGMGSDNSSNRKCLKDIVSPSDILQRCVRNICENHLNMKCIDITGTEDLEVDIILLDAHGLATKDELDLRSLYRVNSSQDTLPPVVVLGTHPKVLTQLSKARQYVSIASPITARKLGAALRTAMAMPDTKDKMLPSKDRIEPTKHNIGQEDKPYTAIPNLQAESVDLPGANIITHLHGEIPSRPRQPQTLPPQSKSAPRPGISCRFKRLLLVDDNAINLKVLAAFAQRLHVAYTTAVDGAEAVRLYQRAYLEENDPYDCIFMDISMPILDGFQAAAAIRQFENQQRRRSEAGDTTRAPSRAYILALTGLGSEDARNSAKNSGMDVFLLKPLKFKDVVSLLKPGS